MRFAVYLEKEPDSDYGVAVPDLPGCYSAGETIDIALAQVKEAILTHIEGILLDNEDIPVPADLEEHKNTQVGKDLIWALVEVDITAALEYITRHSPVNRRQE